MLGRLARGLAAPAFRANVNMTAQKTPLALARRNISASAPRRAMPQTLSVRWDGLFTQCCVAAIIHFVPQDIIILAGVLWIGCSASSAKSPKTQHADLDAAVEAFKAQKGLDDVNYRK